MMVLLKLAFGCPGIGQKDSDTTLNPQWVDHVYCQLHVAHLLVAPTRNERRRGRLVDRLLLPTAKSRKKSLGGHETVHCSF